MSELRNAWRRPIVADAVDAAFSARCRTSMGEMMEGSPPIDVILCLGPGRCLVPREEGKIANCPFCRTVPKDIDASSPSRRDAFVSSIVDGN